MQFSEWPAPWNRGPATFFYSLVGALLSLLLPPPPRCCCCRAPALLFHLEQTRFRSRRTKHNPFDDVQACRNPQAA